MTGSAPADSSERNQEETQLCARTAVRKGLRDVPDGKAFCWVVTLVDADDAGNRASQAITKRDAVGRNRSAGVFRETGKAAPMTAEPASAISSQESTSIERPLTA